MDQDTNPVEIGRPDWLESIEGLLESLNEGVIITDDCHRLVFVNSCFEEMIGRPAAEMVGRSGAQFYTQEEFGFILKQIELSAATGRHRFEFVLPLHDGSRLPVIVSSRRLEDPDGRDFAIVTFTDISQQKSAQAQLRDANVRLEERQKEIEEDLALAARVQQSLAPKSIAWGGLRVDTYYHPVRTIGGDFGLVSPLDDEHLNLLVCDVSGHGIGSALIANRIYTETATQLRNGTGLGVLFHAGRGSHRARRAAHGFCRGGASAGDDRQAGRGAAATGITQHGAGSAAGGCGRRRDHRGAARTRGSRGSIHRRNYGRV